MRTLRGLHQRYLCALRVSQRWAEALSARGCVQTRVGAVSPSGTQRAVPPRLSLG